VHSVRSTVSTGAPPCRSPPPRTASPSWVHPLVAASTSVCDLRGRLPRRVAASTRSPCRPCTRSLVRPFPSPPSGDMAVPPRHETPPASSTSSSLRRRATPRLVRASLLGAALAVSALMLARPSLGLAAACGTVLGALAGAALWSCRRRAHSPRDGASRSPRRTRTHRLAAIAGITAVALVAVLALTSSQRPTTKSLGIPVPYEAEVTFDARVREIGVWDPLLGLVTLVFSTAVAFLVTRALQARADRAAGRLPVAGPRGPDAEPTRSARRRTRARSARRRAPRAGSPAARRSPARPSGPSGAGPRSPS
jgi:hypothetical protein